MRKLNIRLQSYNRKKVKYEIDHDLRTKYTSHIKNNNDNFVYIPGEKVENYKYDKKEKSKVRNFRNEINKRINGVYTYHKNEYKKKYKRNLREDRTNSINRGVFTFPKDLDNNLENEKFDKKEFMKLGIKTIENICKELNIKLIYITCHFDETTPHFHYMTSNFDNNLKPITRNKEVGIKLQDLSEKYFKEYGFSRGVSKEITGTKNLKNENDKLREELKQSKIEMEKIDQENIKLKKENLLLKNNNDNLKNEIIEHRKELREIKKEFTKVEIETNKKKEIYNQVFKPLKKEYDEMIKMIKTLDKKGIERVLTNETIKKRVIQINKIKDSLKKSRRLRDWEIMIKEVQEEQKQKPKEESYNYSGSGLEM